MTETVKGAQTRGGAPGSQPGTVAIAMVGAGRAGSALAVALRRAGHPVVAIWSRDAARAAALAERVEAAPALTPLAAVRAAEVAFLAVPDRAIVPVAASVAASGAALRRHGVAHLSAGLDLDVLAAVRATGAAVGSLHPLQALAGEASAANLRDSLMAVDGDPPILDLLRGLAVDLGGRPVTLNRSARSLYHAAAVLAGNAPLALLAAATQLLEAIGLDRDTAEAGLLALMRGALDNAARAGTREGLTGPVARADTATVARHLAALHDHPGTDSLYRALALATVRLAGESGREEILRLIDSPVSQNGRLSGGAKLRAKRDFAQARAQPRRAKGADRQSRRTDARVERSTSFVPLRRVETLP